MHYRFLADLIVLLHLAFIVFVILGGFFIIWWRKAIWIHFPSVVWAAWIEFRGGICPLTPFENWLRSQGGQAVHPVDFVDKYIMPLVYPPGLTRGMQIGLAAIVIFINGLLYGYLYLSWKTR